MYIWKAFEPRGLYGKTLQALIHQRITHKIRRMRGNVEKLLEQGVIMVHACRNVYICICTIYNIYFFEDYFVVIFGCNYYMNKIVVRHNNAKYITNFDQIAFSQTFEIFLLVFICSKLRECVMIGCFRA